VRAPERREVQVTDAVDFGKLNVADFFLRDQIRLSDQRETFCI